MCVCMCGYVCMCVYVCVCVSMRAGLDGWLLAGRISWKSGMGDGIQAGRCNCCCGEAAVDAQMRRTQIHADGDRRSDGGRGKSGGLKFMWTVLCGSGDGRANAAGPHACGRCLQKRRWMRKCGGSKNHVEGVLAEAVVGAQMRRAHIHVDGVLQRRRWARKCGGPKFMWTAFAEAAVGAQMRRAQIHVDGVWRSCGGRANARVQIHVGGVLRKRRWARKCGRSKFMWTAFAEAAVDAQMRVIEDYLKDNHWPSAETDAFPSQLRACRGKMATISGL